MITWVATCNAFWHNCWYLQLSQKHITIYSIGLGQNYKFLLGKWYLTHLCVTWHGIRILIFKFCLTVLTWHWTDSEEVGRVRKKDRFRNEGTGRKGGLGFHMHRQWPFFFHLFSITTGPRDWETPMFSYISSSEPKEE